MVFCQAARGKDAVHMHMVIQLLVPCVEYLDDAWKSAEIFFISGQFQEGFGTAGVKQAVQKLLVAVNKRIQFMRKSKYHMEIGRVNDLSPAFVHPDLFEDALTFGAASVTAGIVMEFYVSAVRTLADIAAKFSGFADTDSMGGFSLYIRQTGSRFFILLVRVFENLTDMVLSHGRALPCGQKG